MKKRNFLPVIGIAVFLYLVYSTGIEKILKAVSEADFILVFPALVFTVLLVFLQAYKWDLVLKSQKTYLSFWKVVKMQFAGIFYGIITPGKIGSFIKIDYLSKETGKRLSSSGSSVVIERVLDLLCVFVLALIGSVFVANIFSEIFFYVSLLFFLFAFALVVFFVFKFEKSRNLLRVLHRFLVPEKLKQKSKDSFKEFYSSFPSNYELVFPFITGIVYWIATYSIAFIVMQSLGLNIGLFELLALLPIVTLITLIPVTVSGFGTREASLIVLLGFFGIAPEAVIAFSLLSFFVANVPIALIGAYYSTRL